MENLETTQPISALEALIQKTESVAGDFSIHRLATEIKELIDALPKEYIWFGEQINFFVNPNILRNYNPLDAPKNIKDRENVLRALNRLSYATANISGASSFPLAKIMVTDILDSELSEENHLLWLYTLRQAFSAEYKHDIALQFLDYLKKNPEKTAVLLTSDKKILYLFLLDLVWLDLYGLSGQLEFILQTVFFHSLVFHCPVTAGLATFLSLSTSQEEYQEKKVRIIKTLAISTEPMTADESEVSLIMDELEAETLGRPFAGENSVAGQYNFELDQLATWFLDPTNWKKIIIYFLQTNSLVNLANFLGNLKEVLDLYDAEAVDVVIRFQDMCRENKIISNDQELIYFSESDSQFHWNEELLS